MAASGACRGLTLRSAAARRAALPPLERAFFRSRTCCARLLGRGRDIGQRDAELAGRFRRARTCVCAGARWAFAPVRAVIRRVPAATPSSATISNGADLAGVVQVRAAAQLAAELAHRDHADRIGIFFAEEHHRAGGAGLGERHELPLDRLGGGDALGHVVLDRGEFLGLDRRRVAEVEPQPVVLDLRAQLLGVLAEVLLQGVVQDVRGRVGPANALPAVRIDAWP